MPLSDPDAISLTEALHTTPSRRSLSSELIPDDVLWAILDAATLTSLYVGHKDEVRELLGLPADALTMALLPLGYPLRGRWAEPKRQPVDAVVHWGRWGTARTRS